MCLLLAAYGLHPRYDLAVAANRDELFARPTRSMDYWREAPTVLGGRDLTAGGTWLGVDARGRFAAVTNFHEPARSRPDQPSRGRLVADFLVGSLDAREYVQSLETRADDFAGFDLLCADEHGLWYASNRSASYSRRLEPGLYGLSNHLLDTPWPKVELARRSLADWVDSGADDTAPLRALLADQEPQSASPFINGDEYGTRCSTVVTRSRDRLLVSEAAFAAGGRPAGHQRFSVAIDAR